MSSAASPNIQFAQRVDGCLYLFKDGAERSIEDKTWREQLQRPETIELIRLSYAISNPEIRQGRDALAMPE